MIRKNIIINANMAEEVRIAITEQKRLIDLDIETYNKIKHKGNIYKGIVSNMEDSLDAAFIDFGEKKQGFLPLSEIRPLLYPQEIKNKKYIKVSEILYKGQEIIIQVTKDEIGSKGAAISTYLSIPGRYVVLMHSDNGNNGISKKINNEKDRKFAKEMLSKIDVPKEMAIIIRTAGMNCSLSNFLTDFTILCNSWKKIESKVNAGKAPTLLYKEPDFTIKTIRDYFSSNVNKIIVDDKEKYDQIKSYCLKYMPDLINVLEKYNKKEPIFQYLEIEKEIESLSKRKTQLPSGGYIIIEQTEALVSIDVNSGKSNKEENHETTVYKTNLEASNEIARQLRLRNLGGIIIIDFIDMTQKKHKIDVEKKLTNEMQQDKAKVKILHITENGTLELTRQRLKKSHRLISHILCEQCEGTGRVHDLKGLAINSLRKITSYLAKKRTTITKLKIMLPINIADFLNNEKRIEILNLNKQYCTQINIIGNPKLRDYDINIIEEKKEQTNLILNSNTREKHQSINNKTSTTTCNHQLYNQKKNLALLIGKAPKFSKTKIEKQTVYKIRQKTIILNNITEILFKKAKNIKIRNVIFKNSKKTI